VHHSGQVRSQVHPWACLSFWCAQLHNHRQWQQFTSGLFWEYCASAVIKICFASVAYPRSNGQAKRANAEVLKGLKTGSFNTKLEACSKKWLDNLQSILWSIRTTATKPTGETPFFLVYGAEAVLPTDIKFGSPRVLAFNEIHQEDLIKDRLLQLEEARCQAALRAVMTHKYRGCIVVLSINKSVEPNEEQ
jgi:hypothetical protein